MIDFSKVMTLYIDGKKVSSFTLNDGFQTWVTPTVSLTLLDNYKAKITFRNNSEIYNLSYKASPLTQKFLSSIKLTDSDGVNYYLTTVSEKDKGELKYNNQYISSGWYSDTNQSGGEYSIHSVHLTRNITNGWYFGYDIQNQSTAYELDNNLLDEAIRRANCAFPRAHIRRTTSSSTNYFEMDDFEDTWLALCTSWTNKVRIQFNYGQLTSYYGAYTTDKTSSAYKQWLGTAVHELGHTFGPPDQASHLPSIYDYSRDRTKALYLQANDIAWIKHAYCDLNGCDVSIFNATSTSDSAAEQPMLMKSIKKLKSVDDGGCVLDFDFGCFDSMNELEKFSSNIVVATLSYNRTEKLNIGGDLELDFNIYTINIIDEEKGILTNKELKVHPQEDIVEENKKYRLYLKEYKKTPCSLLNVREGLVELE